MKIRVAWIVIAILITITTILGAVLVWSLVENTKIGDHESDEDAETRVNGGIAADTRLIQPLTSSTQPNEVKPYTERSLSLIPRKIMQTYKSRYVGKRMSNAIGTVIEKSQEFTHYYYDNNDAQRFIDKFFDRDTSDAWDRLKPGAYKADLFRLCWLFIHGGVYLDVTMTPVMNMTQIFKHIDKVTGPGNPIDLILATGQPCHAPNPMYQALIICRSRHRFIARAITDVVVAVNERTITTNALALTGPIRFGLSLCKYFEMDVSRPLPINPKTGRITGHDNIVVLNHTNNHSSIVCGQSSKVMIKTKYKGWKQDRKNSPHYSSMCRNGTMYHRSSNITTSMVMPVVVHGKTTMFPRIVWQCTDSTVQDDSVALCQEATTLNTVPKFTYNMHNRHQMLQFIETHMDETVGNAYRTLRTHAMRERLWRICVLLTHGGVYIGQHCSIQSNLHKVLLDIETKIDTSTVSQPCVTVVDSNNTSWDGFCCYTGGDSTLKTTLNKMVRFIDQHMECPLSTDKKNNIVVGGWNEKTGCYILRYSETLCSVHDHKYTDNKLPPHVQSLISTTSIVRCVPHSVVNWKNVSTDELYVPRLNDNCHTVPRVAHNERLTRDNVVILLTMTVRPTTSISYLTQTDASERLNIYQRSIRAWLDDGFKVVCVENSDFNDINITHENLEYINVPKEHTKVMIDSLHTDVEKQSKGNHELIAIRYAMKHSTFIQKCTMMVKFTGRYFAPNFKEYLYNVPTNTAMMIQQNPMRCEMMGVAKSILDNVYSFPSLYRKGDFIERSYYTKQTHVEPHQLYRSPNKIPVHTVRNGGENAIVTSL
jgi:mannosyltransferase OCH1-like enzyme